MTARTDNCPHILAGILEVFWSLRASEGCEAIQCALPSLSPGKPPLEGFVDLWIPRRDDGSLRFFTAASSPRAVTNFLVVTGLLASASSYPRRDKIEPDHDHL